MVAFYGAGLDKDPAIAKFHSRMKKNLQSALFNLGPHLEAALAKELSTALDEKLIAVDLN